MEWSDVTIEKYIALKKVMEAKYDDSEKKTFEILAVLHDKHATYFENVPINLLSKLIDESKFIYKADVKDGIPTVLRVGNRTFNVEREVSNLVSGQYIELVVDVL